MFFFFPTDLLTAIKEAGNNLQITVEKNTKTGGKQKKNKQTGLRFLWGFVVIAVLLVAAEITMLCVVVVVHMCVALVLFGLYKDTTTATKWNCFEIIAGIHFCMWVFFIQ